MPPRLPISLSVATLGRLFSLTIEAALSMPPSCRYETPERTTRMSSTAPKPAPIRLPMFQFFMFVS